MSFRVLFVCTGNVCRSPAAELLFARAAVGYDIASASAGTNGLTGHGVDDPTAYALKEIGVDPSRHVAQRLTPALMNAADLILTATTEHRSVVVQQMPLGFRRTFTLREFARLGAELDPLDARRPGRTAQDASPSWRSSAAGSNQARPARTRSATRTARRSTSRGPASLRSREAVTGVIGALGLPIGCRRGSCPARRAAERCGQRRSPRAPSGSSSE